jgi:hypothetical protein
VGHAVEVAGSREEGFGDAFYQGVVLNEDVDERGYLQVLLPGFGEDEQEWVAASRLRPQPPTKGEKATGDKGGSAWRAVYPVGSAVEVCCEELGQGVWWRGSVTTQTGVDGLVVTLVSGAWPRGRHGSLAGARAGGVVCKQRPPFLTLELGTASQAPARR